MSQAGDAGDSMQQLVEAVRLVSQELSAAGERASQQQASLHAKLDNMASSVTRLTEVVDALRTRVEARNAQFTEAHSELRTSMFSKLDRLQGTISLVKEDINVNFASSHNALSNTRSLRSDTQDLADVVFAMQKQYKLLAAQLEELRKDRLDGQSSDGQS